MTPRPSAGGEGARGIDTLHRDRHRSRWGGPASDRVLAYYASAGSLIDGSEYSNSYLSLVTVKGGKIVHWIEFCDPGPLARGVAVLHRRERVGPGKDRTANPRE